MPGEATCTSSSYGNLKGATFPIKTPEELLAAMPDGANTTCRAGDAGKVLQPGDFPFRSAEQVADTIVKRAGL
jgi:hypothetical protein